MDRSENNAQPGTAVTGGIDTFVSPGVYLFTACRPHAQASAALSQAKLTVAYA
ncbi:hypothetical protein [Phyllobacterium myrsinacearum]|uniref:Uncharacterized protein n=1 Tax=Phyllobacterium myrsinacearum TaxID=28101 RepID=A0A839ETT8_9HYPH|nr:hypothetical protein [Phyllobacterium myrsinacearum]MBA8881525.1 hypothetical protein [Phyllobacterium myrsinacearum]